MRYTNFMVAKVLSATAVCLDGVLIEVETDILNGLPAFTIVGLPDKAVEESKERVRSAIKNSGAEFPTKKVTVNLAPGDLPKEGPSFDLYRDIIEECSNSSSGQSIKLIASGGISHIDELPRLKELGCEGVIIGKAIYENRISLQDLERFF